MEYLETHYHSSLLDHFEYKKVVQSNYVIEITGISTRFDLIYLYQQYGFEYQKSNISTSETSDKKYTKTNSIIKQVDKLFVTTPLVLQKQISLIGYTRHEKMTSLKEEEWGMFTTEETIKFGKEKVEERHIFKKKDMMFYLTSDKLVLTCISLSYDDILRYLSFFLTSIYINYPYILLQQKEDAIKTLIRDKVALYSLSYLTTNKDEKSIVIKDYFYTTPCVRFNVGGELFLMDQYENLKKVGHVSDPDYTYNEKGFMYLNNEFVSLHGEYTTHYTLDENDALVYYNEYIEVYTRPSNIYTDSIVNGMLKRQNYVSAKMKDFFYFSKKAMNKKQLKYITSILNTFRCRKIVKRFCNDLDIEYLLSLDASYKDLILYECKKMNTWVSNFFVSILSYEYDESSPFVYQLQHKDGNTDTIDSSMIKKNTIELKKRLENECMAIDHAQKDKKLSEYYKSSMKLLDQFKIYCKELEKRTHIMTNSWMKCWEMIHTFHLIPADHDSSFTVFCNAEFPGSFLLAINHYMKTQTNVKQYEWYANSIWPSEHAKKMNKEIHKDSFKLYEKYPDHWLMNQQNGGDITTLSMINIIEKKLKNKVDLYTGDVSNGSENEEDEQKNVLGQIICGLKVLKNGGVFVCKLFTFFKEFTMSLLFMLSGMFKEFYITKPMSSRPIQTECYIVGKGYTRNDEMIDILVNALVKEKYDLHPIDKEFYIKMLECSYHIFERQIQFSQENMSFIKNAKNRNDIEQKPIIAFRKQIVDQWKTKFKIPFIPKEEML